MHSRCNGGLFEKMDRGMITMPLVLGMAIIQL
jgi:hypothetical protein